MSHYDDSVEISWAVLSEWCPSDDRVVFDESSVFEKRVSGSVFCEQTSPTSRIQWASFFASLQSSIVHRFSIHSQSQTVIENSSISVDDVYWDLKQEVESDDVVSALYRLNVPFRVLITKSKNGMQYPKLSFQLFDSVNSLQSSAPEPIEVLINDSNRNIDFVDRNFYATDSISLLEWAKYLDRGLSTREEQILEYSAPSSIEKSVDEFERIISVGEKRLGAAESLAEFSNCSVFSEKMHK